jgi:hypothetical protein
VQVLFVKLKGIDFSGDDAMDRMQATLLVMQEAINGHGGFIKEFSVDDKGCVCVAAFRAVDCVQADCAFECVQAAMEIECGVHGLEGECSIGITVRARPGRSSALIIFHSRSILYGASA